MFWQEKEEEKQKEKNTKVQYFEWWEGLCGVSQSICTVSDCAIDEAHSIPEGKVAQGGG